MDKRSIYITQFDLDRLNLLVAEKRATGGDNAYLAELETELGQAEVVDPKDIPVNVVTMNSKVRMKDVETGEEMTYSLVFPQDANIDEDKLSILAPVGTGMIGYKAGDIIEWPVPAGIRKIQILEILYQPEASGDFDL